MGFMVVTKTSTFRIPPDIKEAAQKKAEAENKTLSRVVTDSLREYAAGTEKNRMIATLVLLAKEAERIADSYPESDWDSGRNAGGREMQDLIEDALKEYARGQK